MALTATRPGEVRFADWSEFDLDASLWTIPAARTKTAADLPIPLPLRAVSVVRMAGTFTRRRTGLVFPSPATGAALSDNTWRKLLQTSASTAPATAFGAAVMVLGSCPVSGG